MAIPLENELYVILAQLERAWGYSRYGLSKQLARFQARGQVREGTHYRKLTNGTLAAFKAAAGDCFANCGVVDPRARNLLVITERGVYRLLTLIPDKAIAIAFQDWLEAEVLPAINRTGRYDSASADAPQLGGPGLAPSVPVPVTSAPAPVPLVPARSLDELRWRVEQLRELALAPGSAALLPEPERAMLARQAASLIVLGLAAPTPRSTSAHRQLAVAGTQDPDAPGLIPLAWTADPALIVRRHQEPCPGVARPYREHTRADLCVEVVACAPYLSDDTLRALSHLLAQGKVHRWPRWAEVYHRAAHRSRGSMAG